MCTNMKKYIVSIYRFLCNEPPESVRKVSPAPIKVDAEYNNWVVNDDETYNLL